MTPRYLNGWGEFRHAASNKISTVTFSNISRKERFYGKNENILVIDHWNLLASIYISIIERVGIKTIL